MSLASLALILNALGILYFLLFMLRDVSGYSRAVGILLASICAAVSSLSIAALIPADPNVFPPTPILLMNGLLAFLIVSLFVPGTRRVWDSIPTDRIINWHIMRLPAGLAFVVLAYDGKLPPEFGYSAGWGDALAGAFAAAYFLVPGLRTRAGVIAWNIVGTLDFVPALGVAALTLNASPFRIFPHGELMSTVGNFPGELIPAFVAPILLFTHILIFMRKFAATGRIAAAEPALSRG